MREMPLVRVAGEFHRYRVLDVDLDVVRPPVDDQVGILYGKLQILSLLENLLPHFVDASSAGGTGFVRDGVSHLGSPDPYRNHLVSNEERSRENDEAENT